MAHPAPAAALSLAAFGDSLTAGWALPSDAAFPARLERALSQKGYTVTIANFGVSGDTTSGGLNRLESVIASHPDGVILELGANDMLRGLDPSIPAANLATMLTRLKAAGIPVLLCGMRASHNFGQDYVAAFGAIYPDLSRTFGLPLYPFFLDGVTGQPELTMPDGLHPNAAGVDVMVERILPTVETFLHGLGAAPAGR